MRKESGLNCIELLAESVNLTLMHCETCEHEVVLLVPLGRVP